MPTIPWNIGPDEIDCEVEVDIYPAEPCVMYDRNNEGYPGSPAYGEITGAKVIENGKRRNPTDEEWEWIEADAEAIEERAFEDDAA